MAFTNIRRNFNSHSGVDMTVTMGGVAIGELQGLSFTITREKAPNYVMGSPDPVAFSRGKRGIAGSMIFLQFDRNALLDSLRGNPAYRVLLREYDIDRHTQGYPLSRSERVGGELSMNGGASNVVTPSGEGGALFENIEFRMVEPIYLDQLPPFDIVITGASEAGHFMKMSLKGCEILNCGSGVSIDDITIDTTATFVATAVQHWNGQKFVDAQGQLVEPSDKRYWDMKPGSAR